MSESEHHMDIVLAGMIRGIKKVYREEFSQLFDELLTSISIDFEIPIEELTERYNPTYKFHVKKPRDPATACLDTTRSGAPCSKTRKSGFDYCGIHLRKRGIDPNHPNVQMFSDSSPPEEPAEERYVPKSPKKSKPKPQITRKPDLEQSDLAETETETETTDDETTNSSHDDGEYDDEDEGDAGHKFDIWEYEKEKYVILDDSKIFKYPGVDEINSIAELGDIVAHKFPDGKVEWV